MKILVVGASQGTGALCVKSALARGHSVSAFSRNPAKLDITHAALTKITGDFHDGASVRGAVTGHDALIICAAPKPSAIKDTPDYFSRGTKYCIEAMKDGVKRLVVLTAFGVGDSEPVALVHEIGLHPRSLERRLPRSRRSGAHDAGERPRLRHRTPDASYGEAGQARGAQRL